MMRMMRSINVAGAVVGYSGVVSCRLLCPLIRPRMIEDNKQFSDYYHPELDAEDEAFDGLMRSGKNSKQFWDNYRAKLNAEYEAFMTGFVGNRRLEDRKNSSKYYQPDHDAVLDFAAHLYDELEVLQKLYNQDPMDVQILKKLAATMTGLATIPILPVEYKQVEEWLRESKSLLEKALDINKNDDNVKFELGRAHYHILVLDRTVKWGSDSYVEHVLSAYRYFKEVEDKGPEVYKHPMLDVLRRFVWPFMSDLEVNID